MADVTYDVPLIPQPDKLSCWAGSMAMLVSFRKLASYPPEQLANDVGRSLRTSYGWDELEAVKDKFGFKEIYRLMRRYIRHRSSGRTGLTTTDRSG
jgi:hypothetical protein